MAANSFDFRALKKYLNPGSSDDLNRFLEKLPQHAGQTALIAAGIAWAAAAALGLFAMMQTKQLTELRGQLQSTEALLPIVPVITMTPVSPEEIKPFLETTKVVDADLQINNQNNIITVQSKDTSQFPEFREALGHVVNGGTGWRVKVEAFCVGRECNLNPLNAVLKVEKFGINKPEPVVN